MSAANKPVSTSPVPPVAIPGLPVGLMCASPSGVATMVGAPFRTVVAPTQEANFRARAMGSRCISAMLHSVRRANSPMCGVSTRGVSQARIASRSPARALSASASMTAGRSQVAYEAADEFDGFPMGAQTRSYGYAVGCAACALYIASGTQGQASDFFYFG